MQHFFVARRVATTVSHLRYSPITALLVPTRNSGSSSSGGGESNNNSEGNNNKNNENSSTGSGGRKTVDANKCQDVSYGSSLYMSFMGSSSRFRYESPIVRLADLTALEREKLSHFPPDRLNDYCCIYLVIFLRWCSDKLFRERYLHRATMLKTIAPVASFAGAAVTYLRMLFKTKAPISITGKGGFTGEFRGLMAQTESHASHAHILMCMTEITYPERAVVFLLQCIHFSIFAILFLLYPRMAFRLLGYLGEESVVIWTHMINDIDLGKVSERSVPQESMDYWGLRGFNPAVAAEVMDSSLSEDVCKESKADTQSPPTKEEKAEEKKEEEEGASLEILTLRGVILLLRSDEMVWRDVCHQAANDIDGTHPRKKSFFSSYFS